MNSLTPTTTKPARATKGDNAAAPLQTDQNDQQALGCASASEPLATGDKMPRGLVVPFYKCIQRQARKIDKITGKPRGYSIVWLSTFAKWFGRTVRTIQDWIAELVAHGWLEKQNSPGKKEMFLRPLLDQLPPLEAWSPTPTRPFLCQKTSQVSSRVTSPNTSYKGSYGAFSPSGCNQVKQQQPKTVDRTPLDPAKLYASDPAKARAAADLLACGFWERGIPGLLAVIEPDWVIDACAIARWRKAKGEEIGGTGPGESLGGYVKRLAEHLKTGQWTAPKGWLRAMGRLKDEPSKAAEAGESTAKTAGKSEKRDATTDAKPASAPDLPPGCPEWLQGRESLAVDWEVAVAKYLLPMRAPIDRWPNLANRARKRLTERDGPRYKHSVDTICQYMAKAYRFDIDAELAAEKAAGVAAQSAAEKGTS